MAYKATELEKDLASLGLLDKVHELYRELGQRSVVSYIRSSHKLLSKVYHPDLNPENPRKAEILQQALNRVNEEISAMTDEELVEVISVGVHRRERARPRILVVEDEFGYQVSLRRLLSMEGYDAKVAVNGAEGYECFEAFDPDLILCDVIMPEMTGLELISRIRKTTPTIRVIYMSGFFGFSSIKEELDAEVEMYRYRTLSKPFKASVLLEAIGDYLAEGGEPDKINTFA